MSSNWVQRVSKTVLAAACAFAFTFASGCCRHCDKPCCNKDKEKETTSTTTTTTKESKH